MSIVVFARVCVMVNFGVPIWQKIRYKRDGVIKEQFVVYENISMCCYYCGDPKHRYESCAMRVRPPEVFYLIRNDGVDANGHNLQPETVMLGSESDEDRRNRYLFRNNQGIGRGRPPRSNIGARNKGRDNYQPYRRRDNQDMEDLIFPNKPFSPPKVVEISGSRAKDQISISSNDKGKGPIISDIKGPRGDFLEATDHASGPPGNYLKAFEGKAGYGMEQQMMFQNINVTDPQSFTAIMTTQTEQVGEASHRLGISDTNPTNINSMESPFDSGDDMEMGYNISRQEFQEINDMMMEQESPNRKRIRDPANPSKDEQLAAGHQQHYTPYSQQ